jgi:hypothetical protein
MNQMQQQVLEFHQKFGVPAPTTPGIPSRERIELRIKLMAEELTEFIDASSESNLVEMIDALCDLLYVTFGSAVELGVDIEPFFHEVQRSNMSKLWTFCTNCRQFCVNGGREVEGGNQHLCIFGVNGKPARAEYVLRPKLREDGKVIKSPNYSPANLGPILRLSGATQPQSEGLNPPHLP